MRQMIKDVGPFTLRVKRDRFGMLVRSIISQQISTKAARSIRAKFEALLLPDSLCPEAILGMSVKQLRSAGLSQQKTRYIIDLADHARSGNLNLHQIGRFSDEKIIGQLIAVKGIGRWTAQMFLIFAMGRIDVFPHDDFGVRSSIRTHYQLAQLPNVQQAKEIV